MYAYVYNAVSITIWAASKSSVLGTTAQQADGMDELSSSKTKLGLENWTEMQQRWTRDFLSPFKADVDCWQYLVVVVVDC